MKFVVTAARRFPAERRCNRRFMVTADGKVLIWDKFAKVYTPNHMMDQQEQARIRDLAA